MRMNEFMVQVIVNIKVLSPVLCVTQQWQVCKIHTGRGTAIIQPVCLSVSENPLH